MKRRDFLRTATPALTLPMMIGGHNVHALGRSNLLSLLENAEENDRVLVLIQLNGGNDGLNTIIPLDQYENLTAARSNIIIDENRVLPMLDGTGFHPSMGAFKELWDKGKVGVVQNVGYPNPNFSHFRSTDIITSASDSNELISSGWLGRYLNQDHSNFPEGYPNEEHPDPLAITVGSMVSTTCQGPITNMGIAINPANIDRLYNPVGTGENEFPSTPYGQELKFVRETELQTQLYLESVSGAASKAQNLSSNWQVNYLADQLRVVSRLIAGGLKTKVYVVSLGGFDTHAGQVDSGGNHTGFHAQLLDELASAIYAFQDELEIHGVQDRVVGMTFTEFGRRVRSNNSDGSDHGTSWPLFLFGSWVFPAMHGSNPVIPSNVPISYNLPVEFDFRSIYGSVLKDWLCVPEHLIREVLFDNFAYLPLFRENLVTSNREPEIDPTELVNYPNPSNGNTRISFNSSGGHVELSVFTIGGQKIETLIDKDLNKGAHNVSYRTSDLRKGIYIIRINNQGKTSTRKLVVNR